MKISVNIKTGSDTPVKYDGYRVLHKVEGGWQNTPLGMPEVMPPINAIAVEMTKEIQEMSFALMNAKNPLITPALWTRVHDGDRAFTNFNGFDMAGDPRANFILNRDTLSPLPKYDKCQRVCGGSFVRGITYYSYTQAFWDGLSLLTSAIKQTFMTPKKTFMNVREKTFTAIVKEAATTLTTDNVLRCVAGIHGIDADKPMPSTQEILDNVWYIYAVSMDTLTQISHFPQGQGGPVLIPFIIRGAIEFPLIHFERWQAETLPDPLRIYG